MRGHIVITGWPVDKISPSTCYLAPGACRMSGITVVTTHATTEELILLISHPMAQVYNGQHVKQRIIRRYGVRVILLRSAGSQKCFGQKTNCYRSERLIFHYEYAYTLTVTAMRAAGGEHKPAAAKPTLYFVYKYTHDIPLCVTTKTVSGQSPTSQKRSWRIQILPGFPILLPSC